MLNKLLSVLLIDDEKLAIENLSNLIISYCSAMKVIESASGVEDGIRKINTLKPDVIFLDINMPGQTGFDLLNQIVHVPLVVFVTAHEKYALRAMKACAVDFLLKPINIIELKEVQTKLLQIHSLKPEIRKNYSQVLRNLSSIMDKPGSMKKITLYGTNGYQIFEINDILYLTGEDNYTVFHFLKQKDVMVTKTLKDYEEILEPLGFMRIHKSTLVNLNHIRNILKKDTVNVLMSDEKILGVSRRKYPDLLAWSKSLSHGV